MKNQEDILDDQPMIKTAVYFKIRGVVIWSSLILLGLIFKVMHWPGAAFLIVTCSAGLSAYSLSGLLRIKWQENLNTVFSILSLIWIVFFVYGVFFNAGIPYNSYGLVIFGIVFIVFFVGYYFVLGYLNASKK